MSKMDLKSNDSHDNTRQERAESKPTSRWIKNQKERTSSTSMNNKAAGLSQEKASAYHNNNNRGDSLDDGDSSIERSNRNSLLAVDEEGDHHFKPISQQQKQHHTQQYPLRGSQSLTSLSLFDISPLVERASSFEYLNYRTSGSVFSCSSPSGSSDGDYGHRKQLFFSDTENEEEFLSVYTNKK